MREHSLELEGLTLITGPSTLLLIAAKQAIHLLHGLLLHSRKHMTVDPRGDAVIALSQKFLDDIGGNTHAEQNRGR